LSKNLEIEKWKLIIAKLVGQAGIGLVETLVAIAILGVVAVTFMTALSAGSISVNNLAQQASAQELATTQMETIRRLSTMPPAIHTQRLARPADIRSTSLPPRMYIPTTTSKKSRWRSAITSSPWPVWKIIR